MSEKKKNNITDDKLWPKEMIIPMPSEFIHGEWIRIPDKNDDYSDPLCRLEADLNNRYRYDVNVPKELRDLIKYQCASQCCLVGFAALAFDEDSCNAYLMKNPATAEFLSKFYEFATGEPLVTDDEFRCMGDHELIQLFVSASDLFEFGVSWGQSMSGRGAHNLWKKTAAHFGYDVDRLIE